MADIEGLWKVYPFAETEAEIRAKVKHWVEKGYENTDTAPNRRLLFSCLELTSLQSTDNEESVASLVEKINRMDEELPEIPKPAAICVYPAWVETVKSTLTENLAITTVVGFPSSQTFASVKIAETALAIADGADEIDMVLPLGKFLQGSYEEVADEIGEIKDSCQGAPLKVIVETGLHPNPTSIYRAALLALASGADFVKTTTGKEKPTDVVAVYTLCRALQDFKEHTGAARGLKIAGGVRNVQDALLYLCIAKQELDEEFINPEHLRIGASQLANALISDLMHQETTYF